MPPSTLPKRRTVLAIIACCAVGAWICGTMLSSQADIWSSANAPAGLFERVCHAAAPLGFTCAADADAAAMALPLPVPTASRATLIGLRVVHVPLAFVGLAYFVFLGVWFACLDRSALALLARWPRRLCQAGAVVSSALLAGMAMGWAPRCVWCVAVHGLNAALVVLALVSLSGVKRPSHAETGNRTAMFNMRRQGWRVALLALIAIGGLWFYRSEHLAFGAQLRGLQPYRQMVTAWRDDADFLIREHYAQPAVSLPDGRSDQAPNEGPRLVVFTDFACPTCACTARRVAHEIGPRFEHGLRVEVRHYPLDAACNDAVDVSAHPNACAAAYAAEAARLQGGDEAFRRMEHELFTRRGSFDTGSIGDLAEQAGLDPVRLEADFHGTLVRQIVRDDIALAHRLEIAGTPTMFLDGRRVGILGADNAVFWDAIAAEYTAAHKCRLDVGSLASAGEEDAP